jgi:exoribonuclease R
MEDSMELIGERTKKVYKIGQNVSIIVDNADKETRLIDFVLAER